MAGGGSIGHIIQSLLVNLAIAAAKAVAAFATGSGALLAEAIHSAADTTNQILLLFGVRRARRAPDAEHPMGYGRSLYFWSFVVALLLFTGGGVFSIYEGVHKIAEPEPVDRVWLGFVILLFSLALEGGSTVANVREINRRRGARGFFRFLHETKDSDLIVVLGENAAASLGLLFALGALFGAWRTGDGRWDGAGSLAVGLVLVGVALFLAVEVVSLLLGEAADPEVEVVVRQVVGKHPEMRAVLRLITIQQGPGEVLLAMKVAFRGDMTADDVSRSINAFEDDLRRQRPEIRWSFIEPDIPRAAP